MDHNSRKHAFESADNPVAYRSGPPSVNQRNALELRFGGVAKVSLDGILVRNAGKNLKTSGSSRFCFKLIATIEWISGHTDCHFVTRTQQNWFSQEVAQINMQRKFNYQNYP